MSFQIILDESVGKLCVFDCLSASLFCPKSSKIVSLAIEFWGVAIFSWNVEELTPLSSSFHCCFCEIRCKSNWSFFPRIPLVIVWLLCRFRWSCCRACLPRCGWACAFIYPVGDSWGFLDLCVRESPLFSLRLPPSFPLFLSFWRLASDQNLTPPPFSVSASYPHFYLIVGPHSELPLSISFSSHTLPSSGGLPCS